MIIMQDALAHQEAAQKMQLGRKCPTCKLYPFYLDAGEAVVQGHVYSSKGRAELSITGMCEFCWDQMELEEERAERTGGVVGEVGELPLEGMVLQTVTNLDSYDSDSGRYDTTDAELAQVMTSMVGSHKPDSKQTHKVVLDIDLPAKLIPSSTEGHFHLYIDKEVPDKEYKALLVALGDAGILEDGYVQASLERGFTAARLPWVKKPSPEIQALVEELTTTEPGDPF